MAEDNWHFSPVLGASILAVLGVYFIYRTRRKSLESEEANRASKNMKMQSVEVEGMESVRQSAISDKNLTSFLDGVNTSYEAFLHGVKLSGDSPCLGERTGEGGKYCWLTYNEVHERAKHFGSGLINIGCKPSQETFIGILAQNCIQWSLAELGCVMYSMVSVSIYDTHGKNGCVFIINQANLETVVCHASKVSLLLEIAEECKCLKTIVKIGTVVTDHEMRCAEKLGIEMRTFQELEDIGKNNLCDPKPPCAKDIFTICYTSGTTGTPKGAIITHENLISNLSSYLCITRTTGFYMSTNDVHISYLPLAHMYEQMNQTIYYFSGARMGFYRGDPKLLLEDIQELKPTTFPAVPRLLNRIYDKVTNGVSQSGAVKKWLFELAMKSKREDLKRGIIRNDTIWDYLIFRKIQRLLGGRVRVISCGSAPLSADVTSFVRCVMGCQLVEGYGQTECTCVVTFQLGDDFSVGHVGPPAPGILVKLVDVPDMEYFASNSQGEVCVKGPNVFKGYFREPEKTAEVIDKDGWLHTGDIGEWTENGNLRIIDRKKFIFKLSQGEYIAPGKVENIYLRSEFVAQVCVTADSRKSYTVAIVVPDAEVLESWAKKKMISGDIASLCNNEVVHKTILEDMLLCGRKGNLNSLEQVKGILLLPEMFSIENGFLTPTMKTKRSEIQKAFKDKLEKLYEKIDCQQRK